MKSITVYESAPVRNRKIRVAAYARVSTDSDKQLLSLEAQKKHYSSYINDNPDYEFAGLYFDEGVSGTKTDKRDDLKRLLKDCSDGKIDRVITKSVSRFARNTVDSLEMVRSLSRLGISMYFEKENIDTEFMSSELVLTILSAIAESESRSISENSKWSIKRRFENGSYVIAYAPFGYSKKGSNLVINPEEAEIVKHIFQMALDGYGSYKIAEILNERDVNTRRGGRWSDGTVRRILCNISYTGCVHFQKTYTDEYFRRHVNYGELDMYACADHHEAIIDPETFEKAAEMTELRRLEKRIGKETDKYSKRYPFSGRIICGECGSVFKRRTHYSTGYEYIAWCCKIHLKDHGKCSMKYIKDEEIKNAVLRMMNKLHFSESFVLKPFILTLKKQRNSGSETEISSLDDKMEKNAELREKLTNLVSSGYIPPEMYETEVNILVSEYEQLSKRRRVVFAYSSECSEHLNEAVKLLNYAASDFEEYSDDMFTDYIDSVTVISREEICFNMKCGLKLHERLG